LRALLVSAGEKRPFILAGHSLGGEYARIYACEHPEDVAGLVLIATSHPDVRRRDPALAEMDDGPDPVQRFMPLVAATGLVRFWPESLLPAMYRDYLNTLRKLPSPFADAELAFVRHTRFHRAVLAEMRSLPGLAKRGDTARHLGDIPLFVISERWTPNPADSTELASARIAEELQAELAAFSTAGRRTVLDGGHVLPITRSKQVSEVILNVVAEARKRNP
jgi:pimeloyl-ACP methyl ester carboxylesterase